MDFEKLRKLVIIRSGAHERSGILTDKGQESLASIGIKLKEKLGEFSTKRAFSSSGAAAWRSAKIITNILVDDEATSSQEKSFFDMEFGDRYHTIDFLGKDYWQTDQESNKVSSSIGVIELLRLIKNNDSVEVLILVVENYWCANKFPQYFMYFIDNSGLGNEFTLTSTLEVKEGSAVIIDIPSKKFEMICE